MSPVMPLTAALLLGMQHALEVDHLVAVTSFVSRRPALRTAAGFGARWGFGHAASVFLFGGVLLLTGARLPLRWEAAGEVLVGLMLVGIGLVTLRAARVRQSAALVAADGEQASHSHRAGVTWVGLTHGLAGTSAVVALVPVTLADSRTAGFGYLAVFGVGTMLAMTAAAVAAALAVRRAQQSALGWAHRVTMVVGGTAVLVGVLWLVRAVPVALQGST